MGTVLETGEFLISTWQQKMLSANILPEIESDSAREATPEAHWSKRKRKLVNVSQNYMCQSIYFSIKFYFQIIQKELR